MNMDSSTVRPKVASSVIDLIGHTPLVELNRIVQALGLRGRLLAKCEMNNPGLSKKDRVALAMIEAAQNDGRLKAGQTVVEMTSGNTGTGLALVCAALGHPFVAVMSKGNTPERAAHMHALGAEVVLVDQLPQSIPGQVTGDDLKEVEKAADKITAERGAFRAGQFSNAANVFAHETTTGPELWHQSDRAIDVFVDCPGTAGSFTGVSRYLKSMNPAIRCYVVEPEGARVLAERGGDCRCVEASGHKIQGAGYARTDDDLPLFDRSLADGYLAISDELAVESARLLARIEGLVGGFSTGAHLAAAIELLRTSEQGSTIAFLACDSGLKYLSTDLFESVE
jgi:cysteine synthase A